MSTSDPGAGSLDAAALGAQITRLAAEMMGRAPTHADAAHVPVSPTGGVAAAPASGSLASAAGSPSAVPSSPAKGAPDPGAIASIFTPGVPGPFVAAPGFVAPSVQPHVVAAAPALSPPPGFGPSALSVGAGGLSGAQTAPPTPGFLQQPPLASAPPPKESDLRNVVTTVPQAFGAPSLALSAAGVPATAPTPYFLDLAGPPRGLAVPDLSSWTPGPLDPLGDLSGLSLGLVPAPAPEPASPGPAAPWLPNLDRVDRDVRPEAVPALSAGQRLFDPRSIKRDFPILNERVHGKPLVWLDNAATTQKPQAVIDRLSHFYAHENSNIHRAAHALAARATDAYEGARDTVARFLKASSSREIVFTRGATEAINLVAQSWGRRNVRAGDEIVVSWLEHHANIVPWHQLCAETGARLRVIPVDDDGQVRLDEYQRLLGPRTRLVAITQVSNALGTIVPVQEMVATAHRFGACTLVDGAQAVSHMRVDVQAIDCEFYCFSGHKVFAPTGIGALFGKAAVLADMPPWQGGGNMIEDVTFEAVRYQKPPMRFEAGTGNIADAVGLGAAIDYLESLGLENVSRYEHDLLTYATGELLQIPGLRLIGTAPDKAGVLSFVLDGIPTESVGRALDQDGIAVRSGHHCAQPILRRFGLESSVRASLAPYNTCEDIDALVATLRRLRAQHPRGR